MSKKSVLKSHVLVLNRSWTAIGTTSVKNAIVLMCRDSAKAICPTSFMSYEWEEWLEADISDLDTISTPSGEINAPDIIVLTDYNDLHNKKIKFRRRAVYKRDKYTCQYCKKQFKGEDLSLDHVIPRSKNGPNSWENCVTACKKCNSKKGDKSLKEAGLNLHPKPKPPKWSPVAHLSRDSFKASWKQLIKED